MTSDHAIGAQASATPVPSASLESLHDDIDSFIARRDKNREYVRSVQNGVRQAHGQLQEFAAAPGTPVEIGLFDYDAINGALERSRAIPQQLQQVRAERKQVEQERETLHAAQQKKRIKLAVIAAIILAIYFYF